MRIVLIICVVLLFASYYFRDSIQITHDYCLCDPCHAEKMEHIDHNDVLVPDIEGARDYDENVADDCYEPDSDPDLSDVEAPYSDGGLRTKTQQFAEPYRVNMMIHLDH
uniref:Secreted protein n=1 Tax=Eutreptiella gymnastica TaxID=73025 RepID=A0A7S1I827_9EUGL